MDKRVIEEFLYCSKSIVFGFAKRRWRCGVSSSWTAYNNGIVMVVGFLLSKTGYLKDTKGLSIVLTKVAVPANMVVLLQREYSHEY